MGDRRFDLIGIDGDDTLWHNERDHVEGRERFMRMIARHDVALEQEHLTDEINRTELQNIQYSQAVTSPNCWRRRSRC